MKKKTNITTYFFAVAVIAIFTFSGCKKEEKSKGGCISMGDIEAFNQKFEAFMNNPTKANCSAYKEASLKYLELLKKCPEMDEAAEGIKALIDQSKDMDCNDL